MKATFTGRGAFFVFGQNDFGASDAGFLGGVNHIVNIRALALHILPDQALDIGNLIPDGIEPLDDILIGFFVESEQNCDGMFPIIGRTSHAASPFAYYDVKVYHRVYILVKQNGFRALSGTESRSAGGFPPEILAAGIAICAALRGGKFQLVHIHFNFVIIFGIFDIPKVRKAIIIRLPVDTIFNVIHLRQESLHPVFMVIRLFCAALLQLPAK